MHGRVAADSHFDFLSERIVGNRSDCLLRAHAAYNLCPVAFDALLSQLEADGVHDPVGKDPEEQVGIGVLVKFMVYRSQVQVCLQLPVRALDVADQVVVVPGRLLVQLVPVGAEEVGAELHLVGDLQRPFYGRHVASSVQLRGDAVEALDGRVLGFQRTDALDHLVILFDPVLLPGGGVDGRHAFFELLAELPVHRLLLEPLPGRFHLQEVVSALFVLDLGEADFLLMGRVKDLHGLRSGLQFVVRQAAAGHAEVVVSLPLDAGEVLLCGDARIDDYERIVAFQVVGRIFEDEFLDHIRQGFRVGGVALQNGAVPGEALRVDAEGQHQQLAVAAFLLAAAELRLPASVLAALEVEVRQVEQHDSFRRMEQAVGPVAKVGFQLVLDGVKVGGHLVNAVHIDLVLVQLQKFADAGVLLYDVDGPELRRCIYRPGNQVCNGKLHLLLAPALTEQELFQLELPDSLQAEPLGSDVSGVRVMERVGVDHLAGFADALVQLGLRNVHGIQPHHLRPDGLDVLPDCLAVMREGIAPERLGAAVLLEVIQPTADIPDFFRTQSGKKAHCHDNPAAHTAGGITERLLEPVVLLVFSRRRVISDLRDEVHGQRYALLNKKLCTTNQATRARRRWHC